MVGTFDIKRQLIKSTSQSAAAWVSKSLPPPSFGSDYHPRACSYARPLTPPIRFHSYPRLFTIKTIRGTRWIRVHDVLGGTCLIRWGVQNHPRRGYSYTWDEFSPYSSRGRDIQKTANMRMFLCVYMPLRDDRSVWMILLSVMSSVNIILFSSRTIYRTSQDLCANLSIRTIPFSYDFYTRFSFTTSCTCCTASFRLWFLVPTGRFSLTFLHTALLTLKGERKWEWNDKCDFILTMIPCNL
jgi:hypothetical protein